MTDFNRLSHLAIARSGLIAAAALALGATASAKQQRSEPEQRSATQIHQLGTAAAPFIVEQHPASKTAEEAENDQLEASEKRENDNNMVLWTRILAGVGFLQLIVFGYQAYKLRQTVSGSEKAIKASQRSAKAAEDAVAKSDEMLAHTRDAAIENRASTKRIERAYIFAGLEKMDFDETRSQIFLHVGVRNSGKTPGIVSLVRSAGHRGGFPHEPPLNLCVPFVTDTVFGADIGGELFRTSLPNNDTLFTFSGDISYSDIFGDAHTSRFCSTLTLA